MFLYLYFFFVVSVCLIVCCVFVVKYSTEGVSHSTGAFGPGDENIPRFALTVGVGTVMEARRLVLIANGKGKAEAIRDALQGPVGPNCPASYLKYDREDFFLHCLV
jgi:glucosamine-6-phosphate deaminase